MHLRRMFYRASLILLATSMSAVAEGSFPPLPTNEQGVQEQLKTFDPAAVSAARHYYESPKIKDGLLSMLKNLSTAIIADQEKSTGKKLSEADRAKVVTVLDQAMKDNFDLLLRLNMIAAVETLSKEQLNALDQFYSSPVGQSILDRMPKVGQRLPEIMQVFMPKFMGSVQAGMKSASAAAPR